MAEGAVGVAKVEYAPASAVEVGGHETSKEGWKLSGANFFLFLISVMPVHDFSPFSVSNMGAWWVLWRCAGSWSLVLFVAALSNRFPKPYPVFQLRPLKVFKCRDTSIMASALSELHRDQTAICLRLTCSRNITMRLSGHAAGIGSVAHKDLMRQRPVATLPQLFYWGDLRAH